METPAGNGFHAVTSTRIGSPSASSAAASTVPPSAPARSWASSTRPGPTRSRNDSRIRSAIVFITWPETIDTRGEYCISTRARPGTGPLRPASVAAASTSPTTRSLRSAGIRRAPKYVPSRSPASAVAESTMCSRTVPQSLFWMSPAVMRVPTSIRRGPTGVSSVAASSSFTTATGMCRAWACGSAVPPMYMKARRKNRPQTTATAPAECETNSRIPPVWPESLMSIPLSSWAGGPGGRP